ncbi:MAG: hypothetical protein CMJ64_16505 [Planctomycetaceae bacterium]|nr:hypothetical protein [Planctomycetaceae bacterium]
MDWKRHGNQIDKGRLLGENRDVAVVSRVGGCRDVNAARHDVCANLRIIGSAGLNQCDSCGLENAYCECVPPWRFFASAELLWLDRTQGDSQVFIADQPDLLVPTFILATDVADLLYDVEAGVRGTIGVEHANGNAAEIRYFAVTDQGVTAIATGSNLFSGIFNEASTNTGVTSMMTVLSSDVHSGELNWLTRGWGRIRPIFGARWLWLSEQWDVFESALSTTGTSSEVDNDMYGGQLGFDVCLWESNRKLRVDARFLGAILGNDADLRANRHDTTTVFSSFSAGNSEVAWAGQIDVTARWRPTGNLTLLLGYTGLWMDNVAQITDQTDNFTLSTGAGTFDLSNVTFQGGRFGIELAW